MSWFSKKVKKITKEVTRPFKKVFRTELNRVIGDVKGEVTRSPELRAGLEAVGTLMGIPPGATTFALKSLRRPEDPIKAATGPPTGPPILAGPGIVPATGKPAVEGSVESWAWAEKYLQSQRKVAQAKAIDRPAAAVEELDIEKLVLPAAAVGLAWWLL